jgi:hypothetical protein
MEPLLAGWLGSLNLEANWDEGAEASDEFGFSRAFLIC